MGHFYCLMGPLRRAVRNLLGKAEHGEGGEEVYPSCWGGRGASPGKFFKSWCSEVDSSDIWAANYNHFGCLLAHDGDSEEEKL